MRSVDYVLALPTGTMLEGRFGIREVVEGSSPVAITYRAHDAARDDVVVVKELLPRALASRAGDGLTVRPHSNVEEQAFSRSLRRFMREAEAIADAPVACLPRIRTQFLANGTGYFVADVEHGEPLDQAVARAGGRLDLDTAITYVRGLLGALQSLHDEGMIHGDVHPANLWMRPDGSALLLGIGTTRHVLASSRDPVPGFTPIEVYGAREVGPWTDVYAVGAVLYLLLTGEPPLAAVERAAGGVLALPRPTTLDIAPSVSRVMMNALALLPEGRMHSAAELMRRLEAAVAAARSEAAYRADHQGLTPLAPPSRDAAMGALPDSAVGEVPPLILPVEEPHEPMWMSRLRSLVRRPQAVAVVADIPAPVPAELPDFDLLDDAPDASTPVGWGARIRGMRRPLLGLGAAAVVMVLAFLSATWGSRAAASPPAAFVATTPSSVPPYSPRTTSAPVIPSGHTAADREEAPRPPVVTPEPRRDTNIRAVHPERRAEPDAAPAIALQRVPALRLGVPLPAPTTGVSLSTLATLRERIAQGKLKAEFGDYTAAGRSFATVLADIEQIGAGTAANSDLAAIRQEAETARARAARACAAESAVLQARGEPGLRCE